MAINIGGCIGPFAAGLLMNSFGFSFAFAASAFGMLIALFNSFYSYSRSLKGVGDLERPEKKDGVVVKVKWTKDEKKRVWVFIGLCVSNILWNIFYALPYGLLTLWASTNVDRTVFGWEMPAAWFYGGYGLLIVLFSPIIATIYKKLDEKNIDFTLSFKLSTAYFLLAIGCLVMMPFVIRIAGNNNYVGSMTYLVLFYVVFAFSELLTVPVLLSAATKFAPKGFSATLVSLNMLISWSIGGL